MNTMDLNTMNSLDLNSVPFFPIGVGSVMEQSSREHSLQQASSTNERQDEIMSRSCFQCEKAHSSCDRRRPCSRCNRLKQGDKCFFPPLKKRGRKPTKPRSSKSANTSASSQGQSRAQGRDFTRAKSPNSSQAASGGRSPHAHFNASTFSTRSPTRDENAAVPAGSFAQSQSSAAFTPNPLPLYEHQQSFAMSYSGLSSSTEEPPLTRVRLTSPEHSSPSFPFTEPTADPAGSHSIAYAPPTVTSASSEAFSVEMSSSSSSSSSSFSSSSTAAGGGDDDDHSNAVPLLVSEPCTANCAVLERFVADGGLIGLLRSFFGHVVETVETADSHTLVWLRWLQQLQLQLQLPDYARAFVDNEDSRKLLLSLLRREEGPLAGDAWAKKRSEESVSSMGTRLFRPLFSSLSGCFERAGGVQAQEVRSLALRSGVVKGILASLGEIEKVSARVPESFLADDDISKRLRTLEKGKQPAAEHSASAGPSNVNPSAYWAAGTGYGHGSTASNWSPEKYEAEKHSNAECTASILSMLASFCEVAAEDAEVVSFDEVHQLFGDSCLIPLLVSYLRNDSLLDMMKMLSLYKASLRLVKVLAENVALSDLLEAREGESVSIVSLLKIMHVVASSVVKNARKMEAVGDAASGDASGTSEELELAQAVQETYSAVRHAPALRAQAQAALVAKQEVKGKEPASDQAPQLNSKDGKKGNNTQEKKGKQDKKDKKGKQDKKESSRDQLALAYAKALQHQQFRELDMSAMPHHYKSSFTPMSRPKMKRLVREVASLASNMPFSLDSSVYLRVDENHLDRMKALIIGPAGTPYADGCFQFDIYCHNQYPNNCPVVNLMTTGQGSVRFNPNLYNCGKVCLSLLGTWSGASNESWTKASTLLQVLVSIQSLIFVEHPYFNEPGYESTINTPSGQASSRIYSNNIEVQTVRVAMVGQLQQPSQGFEDVIRSHFKVKGADILARLETMSTRNTVVRTHLNQLRAEIGKLSSYVIPEPVDDESDSDLDF